MVLISICLDGNSQIACTFTHFKNTSYQIKKGNNIIFLLLTILCIIIMYVPFITIKHAINKSHDQNLVQIHWKQFIYWIAASYLRQKSASYHHSSRTLSVPAYSKPLCHWQVRWPFVYQKLLWDHFPPFWSTAALIRPK